jgi:hypothetical protein
LPHLQFHFFCGVLLFFFFIPFGETFISIVHFSSLKILFGSLFTFAFSPYVLVKMLNKFVTVILMFCLTIASSSLFLFLWLFS